MFAQKKPNGKLRFLVDLRKLNNLISDDSINNNHPVSTLTDAAQHMAGKNQPFLQIRLFASLPLFADGRPTNHRNACIQLC